MSLYLLAAGQSPQWSVARTIERLTGELQARVAAVDPENRCSSGVLLTADWLLTARHAAPSTGYIQLADKAGDLDPSNRAQILERHCRSGALPDNDLALLRVKFPVEPDLAWPNPAHGDFEQLKICGFGTGRRRRCFLTDQLHDPEEKLLAIQGIWGSLSPDSPDSLIVTRTQAQGAVRGDSGGPLFGRREGRWYLLGVLSAGDEHGTDLFSDYSESHAWLEAIRSTSC